MFYCENHLLRVSEANEVPISSHMGHLDDIQTALKPLKKRKRLNYIFMTILGLAQYFKTMNRPDPA